MTTLTTAPVAPLIERLLRESDERSPVAGMDETQRARMVANISDSDYLNFYARMKDFPLAVSKETGILLYMLVRATKARAIVEFGTSFGVSTLHLASGLRDNGGGRLITCEFEPSKVVQARANLEAGGVLDLVDLREGDALETLSRDLPETIDILLLDGAKALYPKVLALLEKRLRPGTMILADNAHWCPEYLEKVRSPSNGYLSIPFAPDVELSMRLG